MPLRSAAGPQFDATLLAWERWEFQHVSLTNIPRQITDRSVNAARRKTRLILFLLDTDPDLQIH